MIKGSLEAIAAGKKAADTKSRKTYDTPEKNTFRREFISLLDTNGITLALESSQGLFVKAMPNAKFYLFEFDKITYKILVAANYHNVIEIFNSDIVASRQLKSVKFKQAFFDFCNSFDSNVERIALLKPIIDNMQHVGFTFSQRGTRAETQTYAIKIVTQLQQMFPTFDCIGSKVYNDTSTMIGIIFKNKKPWVFDNIEINNVAPKIFNDCMTTDERIATIRLWMENYSFDKWGCSLAGEFGKGKKKWLSDGKTYYDEPDVQVAAGCALQAKKVNIVGRGMADEQHFVEMLSVLPEEVNREIAILHRQACIHNPKYEFKLSIPEFIVTHIINRGDRTGDFPNLGLLVSVTKLSPLFKKNLITLVGEQIEDTLNAIDKETSNLETKRKELDKNILNFQTEKAECFKKYENNQCPEFCTKVTATVRNIERQRVMAASVFAKEIEEIRRVVGLGDLP
jgi:hypothetical protein